MRNIVWAIGGSDCSGGAGIQADTKAIHNLGAHACSAVTAVTAQNKSQVSEINSVTAKVLMSQLEALASEFKPQVIKIGLLANVEQVELISNFLTEYRAVQSFVVVYDPVAVASTGNQLTEEETLAAIKDKLLPLVDVLTPNLNESQKLSGVYPFSWNCLRQAAKQLKRFGIKCAVLKGGHLDLDLDYSVDACFDFSNENTIGEYWLANARLEGISGHGTGCTFASALASLLAQGFHLRDAFALANAYVHQGISFKDEHAVVQGEFPKTLAHMPKPIVFGTELAKSLEFDLDYDEDFELDAVLVVQPSFNFSDPRDLFFASEFTETETKSLGLYPVMDSLAWLEKVLIAGCKTVQYREKELAGKALDEAVKTAVMLGEKYQARLFINDHWQLAIKHNAYGVHLGQEDLNIADLAQINSAGLRLGISTHGHYEFLKTLQYKPSYIAVGAIFPTQTKDMTGQIQGLDTLAKLVELNQQSEVCTPMVAIGGITLEKASDVIATGVESIAVVTAITKTQNDDYLNVIKRFNAFGIVG